MVGVPGKYKGCNTCRLRRVKCDNERPFCRKCIDSGRECKGYDRETVFIIGTIEDGGRCSSHPPRNLKGSRRGRASAKNEEETKLELIPVEPLHPAWDDLVSLSSSGTVYRVQIAALHTSLQIVVRNKAADDANRCVALSFPPYSPVESQPSVEDDDFELRSQCLIHLSPVEDSGDDESMIATDSVFLFLYEHNSSLASSNLPPWKDPAVQGNRIRQLGPDHFRTFPAHHFFVRVYRHNAICAALLNRKPTFLSGPEWMTVPWEAHPKSLVDTLFDIIVLIPSLLSRADRILPHDPTLSRRLMAQDLLANCLSIERQLDGWHASVLAGAASGGDDQSQLFWIEDPGDTDAQIPFADPFAFRDGATALAFIYLWSTRVLFYPCVESLQQAVFQPVVDHFPQVYPDLPPGLLEEEEGGGGLADPQRYGTGRVREMAASICRGLDSALAATAQPDALVVPVYVAEAFYSAVSAATGDGALELLWLEAFKARLTARGRDMAEVIQSRKWTDVTEF
ncbi:C6 zinc finger domain protein [Pleurostoma richardsiae]|uniref:C6 zinc finger domain protein n=1 Tax=Pleurostoma richardsiae TaxID=41990 RepID=A0AA38RME7_9PEZI|nr:C6 zinc finger domain protein [Pleurostoma richardsiae]